MVFLRSSVDFLWFFYGFSVDCLTLKGPKWRKKHLLYEVGVVLRVN